MEALSKIAVRNGLVRILETTELKGSIEDFESLLETRITDFLDTLQNTGRLPADIDIRCRVNPGEKLSEALQKVGEREEWEAQYTAASDPHNPGVYLCNDCEHESEFDIHQIDDELPSCPRCGSRMEYHRASDFDPTWDVQIGVDFEVEFVNQELNDLYKQAREHIEDDLDMLDREVADALRDRESEHNLENMLSENYKSPLTLPQQWSQLLKTAAGPSHPDSFFKLQCWAYVLAKHYGVIGDFNFSVRSSAEKDRYVTDVRIVESDDMSGMKEDGKQYEPGVRAGYSAGFMICEMIIRMMVDADKVTTDIQNEFLDIIELVCEEHPDVPAKTAKACATDVDYMERLQPHLAMIRRDVAQRLDMS